MVYYAFQAIVDYLTEGEQKNPSAFYVSQLLGNDVLGCIQILAYRKLNIIGTFGTAVISAYLLVGSLTYINKLDKYYNSVT